MLNGTVSDARLSLVSRPYSATRFLIGRVQGARPVPFELHGSSLRLYVEHDVDLADDKAHTAAYRYVLQAGDQHDSWLVRWEYLRDRPAGYPYALGHLHIRADFDERLGESSCGSPGIRSPRRRRSALSDCVDRGSERWMRLSV